jgi:hypothetical protein
MPRLFWLVFKNGKDITLFIQPGGSLIYARMKAAIAGVDGGFQEGHELDADMARKIPKAQIGTPLNQKQATALLKRLR